jgi:glycosyltransferase involved in cell wall biosynthesis
VSRDGGGLEGVAGVGDVVAAVRLARWLARGDADVAFVHCPECLWLVRPVRALTRFARRRSGRPPTHVVAVWHGAGPRPTLVLRPEGNRLARVLAYFRCLEERGGLRSDAHVAVHATVEHDLRDNYGFSGDVTVIENALDPALMRRYPGAPAEREAGPFTAVWVGQAGHRKGLDVALDAVARARQQVPELRLCAVGVPAQSATDGVEWPGVVAPDQMAEVYRRADVLLFPTRYESFGLVVIEAMAAGLAVIVSDAVPPGIVTDGRNGVVVAGHDPDDYADALLRLYGDNERRELMGEHNRGDVRRFDQAAVADRYVQVAARLARRPP